MSTARLSTKGQLVVPKEIREFLGLEPGDRIDFVVEEDGRVSLRPALVDFRTLRGSVGDVEGRSVTLEEMDRTIRHRHGRMSRGGS
jgi:antitoxin PrlF